ncbi:hypothetical protein CLV80_1105 [Yoonia maritima]|uniref:Uncharacterized protein n=1 Tax=Yoonia maritima TaxID=1435347 RepID=A0A2T0VVT0_9RHOB|nr:hypothetical protein [Yoonia maritima]PRY75920.1 hypothetical protein CLV80_1105 [Yoonia maritima]
MLIKFFRNGKGAGAGPVGYLVADKVLAYDDNRDLIRDADGQPVTVTREPLPEVLRGNPDRTEAIIDTSRHQWTYRAGVISFAAEDAPTEEQQSTWRHLDNDLSSNDGRNTRLAAEETQEPQNRQVDEGARIRLTIGRKIRFG